MIKFPARSLRKFTPGGITVVALYSVTTAGPECCLPTGSESREKITAASFFPENDTCARSGDGLPGLAPPRRAVPPVPTWPGQVRSTRSEEHTSELQSL